MFNFFFFFLKGGANVGRHDKLNTIARTKDVFFNSLNNFFLFLHLKQIDLILGK